MKNFLFLALGLVLVLGSIFLFLTKDLENKNGTETLSIGSNTFQVEIADTPEKRQQGLSGRSALADGSGMFFTFDKPGQYGFWMKDMNFPIDIVWIDENYSIVDIDENLLPETYPKVFYPDQPIKFVLEVPAGTVDKYRIATGTVVQF